MTGKRLKRRRKVERKSLKRKSMSPTRLAVVRERDRLKKQTRNLSVEQLEKRREKDRVHKRVKRGTMSHAEQIISRERDRIRQRLRRGKMTKTERDTERERDRIRKRLKRSAQAGIFSFGTKNSDLWRMEINSWTFDNIDNPWTMPSYTNVSDIMEAAFCVVNIQQNIVEDLDNKVWTAPSDTVRDPLSLSSDEGEDVIGNFDDWESTDYITSDNIGVKVCDLGSGDAQNITEQNEGCEIDLITPEVIITTDNET